MDQVSQAGPGYGKGTSGGGGEGLGLSEMPYPFADPVVKRRLRQAVRELLTDRHSHTTQAEMTECHECLGRFWAALAKVAQKP